MRRAGFVLLLLAAAAARAQDVPAPPPAAEPPPVARPGFFDAIERFLHESKAKIDEQIKGTADAAKEAAGDAAKQAAKEAADAADAAGHATGALLAWPGAKVVRGRVRCAVAPNGAPDCTEAASELCRSKGLGAGKSVDINTAQKCPTWVWLSGRPAPEGTCTTETFVLGAACQ